MFRPHRERPDIPAATSSVLATIIMERDTPSFLFTRRTKTLTSFAGHLSFPGGRVDPADANPLATALRETEEEIGLEPTKIQVLGHFTELSTHFGTLVVVYAGLIDAHDAPHTPTSTREVAEILRVPIETLLHPGKSGPGSRPMVYHATAYEGRRIGAADAPGRTLHYWTLEHVESRERTILWGLTAEIVSRFLEGGYGWTPPVKPRRVDLFDELEP